jgi:lysophospholipase L1-like esterase
MKKTFLLLGTLLFISTAFAQDVQKIKIACVGNSITFGSGIKDRGSDSYPAVLNRLLGTDKYEVRNFGVSARTLLSKGDHPYINEQAYRDAKAFNPNIVTIKLGTNDTKPHNWKHGAEFKDDLRALVTSFQELPSNPTVYLCYPIPANRLSWGINDSTALHHIVPIIAEVAKEMDLTLIDLHTPFEPYMHLCPDAVHPREDGAAIIAYEIAKVINEKDPKALKRRQKDAIRLARKAAKAVK